MLSTDLEKHSREWEVTRIREIAGDYWEYVKRNQKIKDKDGAIVAFVPNSVQRKVAERVLVLLAAGIPVRLIILKARQMGISTEIESIIQWYTSTHKNIAAIVVAHLDDAARNIYEMFRRFHDNALPYFQPKLRYNTKRDLTYDILGSQILTGSAESKEIGRSRTNQIIHNSEVAFWPSGAELVAGLMQTVPYRPNTMVFHESTANGIGGYFYETWQAAKKGESLFEPMFFGWFEMEEYRLPVPGPLTYTENEQELVDQYKLEPEQIMWYRMKLKEFGNDTDRMKQEYPSNDVEAFIASGRPRFDIKALLRMEAESEKGKTGELITTDASYRFTEMEKAPLQIWLAPERLGQYVIGGDVAEGLELGDYSVATVIDRKTMQCVARWRGHCDPDVFGDVLYDLGMWYNTALLGPEVNNHGISTLQKLKDLGYPNIYRREKDYDKQLSDVPAATLGWRTDIRTKALLVDDLATAIREGSYIDYDMTFVREAMTYVKDENGKTNAQEGCFDDCVMSAGIALQMFQWSYTKASEAKVFIPERIQQLRNRR